MHIKADRVGCNGLEKKIETDKEIQRGNNSKASVVNVVNYFMLIFYATIFFVYS